MSFEAKALEELKYQLDFLVNNISPKACMKSEVSLGGELSISPHQRFCSRLIASSPAGKDASD